MDTMGSVREAIAAHHRELTGKLAEQVTRIETSDASGDDLVTFLKTELLPHAAGEEQHLYPLMDDLIRKFGSATASMRLDHEYITAAARQIEEQVQALSDAKTEDARARQRKQLAKAASQLEAVLRLHVDKEERAYLPLFEQHQTPEQQQHILDEMHESAEEEHADHTGNELPNIELDVRPLPPAQRHAVIFRTFDALPGGGAFVLINDHDPKPLYYQLNAERAGQLVWEYLEEGPSEWRVSIGKTR
jgi:uncharacterized protein (DUF2249 family)